MKERIEQFLSTADSPETRDITELRAIYKEISGERGKCKSDICINKMLLEVRKYYHKLINHVEPVKRKYTLKDGNHAFAAGSPSTHNNDNTSDEEIESYLKSYPHIKKLLLN